MDTRNFTYMFYGFVAAWLILIVYVLLLVSREKNIKKQLASLKNILEERESKQAAKQ